MNFIRYFCQFLLASVVAVMTTEGTAQGVSRCEPLFPAPRQAEGAIQFLSDSDKAYGYLETLQEDAYHNNPHAKRWEGTPDEEKKLKELLSQLDARAPSTGLHPVWLTRS